MPDIKEVLRQVADEGQAVLRKHFRSLDSVETKDLEYDLITQADLECEAVVLNRIRENFPDHGILAEETSKLEDGMPAGDYVWVIDPVDGTTNYAHGIPWFGLSIGVWNEGKMILGLVANPAQNEVYFAERGRGATLNGRPIHVTPESDLSKILTVTGFPYDRRERVDYYMAQNRAILQRSRGVRRMGAASIDVCMVAAGHFGAYWECSLNPWDWAPGALIVEEAGGRVTDLDGNDFDLFQKSCVATNGKIHDQILELLNSPD